MHVIGSNVNMTRSPICQVTKLCQSSLEGTTLRSVATVPLIIPQNRTSTDNVYFYTTLNLSIKIKWRKYSWLARETVTNSYLGLLCWTIATLRLRQEGIKTVEQLVLAASSLEISTCKSINKCQNIFRVQYPFRSLFCRKKGDKSTNTTYISILSQITITN
jgi:hypothetical protein